MSDKKVKVNYASLFGEKKGPRSYDITIPSDGIDADDLETVFRYMNHVTGEHPIEAQLLSMKERSLSVGDSVTIDGKTYLCMMAGWKLIETE